MKQAGKIVTDTNQAELIGKIILARFLKSSLKKFERFIDKTEADPFFKTLSQRGRVIVSRFSGAGTVEEPDRMQPNVIGIVRPAVPEHGKPGHDFIILYRHHGFGREYFFNIAPHLLSKDRLKILAGKLRLITTRNRITHEVLNGILRFQGDFFRSDNPLDLKPLTLTAFSLTINASQRGDAVIDHSRISRLINGKSIITPSGRERHLRFFFPTMRDIHKRFVYKILNDERRYLESGQIKRPFNDKQIRDRLKYEYDLAITRRQVAFCRQATGIPNLYLRAGNNSGYPPDWAGFSALYPLNSACVKKTAPSGPGIYELGLKRPEIQYPKKAGHAFYIGSSVNIKGRLRDHLRPGSKNRTIRKYLKEHECFFKYSLIKSNLRENEKKMYDAFKASFGVSPECNRISP